MATTKGYKGLFHESLVRIPEAMEWAEKQDIKRLRRFFIENSNIPLYCFSSGGASSALEYAALLYETNQGMAKSLTPLMMASISDEALKRAKILIVTGDGGGCDEKYTSDRAVALNPKGTGCIVRDCGIDNHVIKQLKRVTTNWFVYDWLTQPKSFIATVETMCKFGLFYRAFTGETEILDKLDIDLLPDKCFTYSPRVEGEIPALKDIKNYIVLYNGWSKPVATDFECKMIESGFASVQLCDYRNFCHGRFIFVSKHIEDSALILFLTPREQQFAKDLILESVNWMDNKDIFPKNTPIIKIETGFDSPLASIDLMVKMQVCFDEIAKALNDEPCKPWNPCGIDKRYPRSTEFDGLLDDGALNQGNLQGSNGTLRSVSRKRVINYDPKMTIEQQAKASGVKVPTIRKYIQDKHIDRKRDDRMVAYNKVWFEYIKDSDKPFAEIARKFKMSPNTVKYYLSIEAKDIVPAEGKIGMASEHPTVNKLRMNIPKLRKNFDKFCEIRQKHPDLLAIEYLKKLGWSEGKNVKNLAKVTKFMQMKEFKYKFKDKNIEFINN